MGGPQIAVGDAARALAQQPRIFGHQFADDLSIATPDRVGHAACDHQTRPVRQPVASRQCGLGIGEFDFCGIDGLLGMMLTQLRDRSRVSLPDGPQQILGLMFELIEVGTDGKVTIVKRASHDGPPS